MYPIHFCSKYAHIYQSNKILHKFYSVLNHKAFSSCIVYVKCTIGLHIHNSILHLFSGINLFLGFDWAVFSCLFRCGGFEACHGFIGGFRPHSRKKIKRGALEKEKNLSALKQIYWGIHQQLKWAKTIKWSVVIDCRVKVPDATHLGSQEVLPKPISQNQKHTQETLWRSKQSYSR